VRKELWEQDENVVATTSLPPSDRKEWCHGLVVALKAEHTGRHLDENHMQMATSPIAMSVGRLRFAIQTQRGWLVVDMELWHWAWARRQQQPCKPS